jgi:lysophospholipase L1-like esterase
MIKKIFTPLSISLFFCYALQAQNFYFGKKAAPKNHISASQSTIYNDSMGYGFEPIKADNALVFSVKLAEGNYKVTANVGDTEGGSTTTIRVENRRVMVEKIQTQKDIKTVVFSVHVRDSLIHGTDKKVRLKPRERAYFHWDNKLTFEFNGKNPKIQTLNIEKTPSVKTVFLAGNSTMVDQADDPYAAWGQMIPAFFNEQIAVANYAESGESASSFISERRLEKVLSLMQKGDYLFIEFGHNDQKQKGAQFGAFTSFKRNLKVFITETRKKGGIPVLVTPANRRNFDSLGKIKNTLEDYPEAIRQLAKEDSVTLIDLHTMTKILYEAWGDPLSKKAFVIYPANTFPNQPKALDDNTHFNPFGAYQIARCIAKGIVEQLPDLAPFLRKEVEKFDPSKPDKPEAFEWFLSPKVSVVKPDGN